MRNEGDYMDDPSTISAIGTHQQSNCYIGHTCIYIRMGKVSHRGGGLTSKDKIR